MNFITMTTLFNSYLHFVLQSILFTQENVQNTSYSEYIYLQKSTFCEVLQSDAKK